MEAIQRAISDTEEDRNIFGGKLTLGKALDFTKSQFPLLFPSEITRIANLPPLERQATIGQGAFNLAGGMISPKKLTAISKEVQEILDNPKSTQSMKSYAERLSKITELDTRAKSRPDIAEGNKAISWFGENREYGKCGEGGALCPRIEGSAIALDKINKLIQPNMVEQTVKGEPKIVDINQTPRRLARRQFDEKLYESGLQKPCVHCYDWSHKVAGDISAGTLEKGTAFYGSFPKENIEKANFGRLPNGKNKYIMRSQGKTDMTPAKASGLAMQLEDQAKHKIPSGSYTKEELRVNMAAPAGEYTNMSISSESPGSSMDWNQAVRLRDVHETASIIATEYNKNSVRRMMDNPKVDHVIPNHLSGSPLEVVQKKLNEEARVLGREPAIIEDFTPVQNDRYVTTTIDKRTGKPIYRINNSKNQIKDHEHWGDINKYMKLARERNLIPRFAEDFLLPEYHSNQIKELVEYARLKQDVEPLWDYLMANKKEWNRNYMKLVGPEYGKFGKVKDGYKPIVTENKIVKQTGYQKGIDLDYALDELQKYSSSGVVPDYSGHVELAEKVLRKKLWK